MSFLCSAAKLALDKTILSVFGIYNIYIYKMPSSWVEHVRAYAAKHNVSYKEAMTAAKASYEKGEKKSSPKAERKSPKAEKREDAGPKKNERKEGLGTQGAQAG